MNLPDHVEFSDMLLEDGTRVRVTLFDDDEAARIAVSAEIISPKHGTELFVSHIPPEAQGKWLIDRLAIAFGLRCAAFMYKVDGLYVPLDPEDVEMREAFTDAFNATRTLKTFDELMHSLTVH